MAYLTSDEYKQLGYSPPEGDGEFDKLEQSAERVINAVTSYYDPYFGFHDLQAELNSSNPNISYKAKVFKKIVAMQVDFMRESKSLSNYQLQKDNMTSYSVDGTSMTFNRGASEALTYGYTGVVKPAYFMLGKSGLLYGGVNHI